METQTAARKKKNGEKIVPIKLVTFATKAKKSPSMATQAIKIQKGKRTVV